MMLYQQRAKFRVCKRLFAAHKCGVWHSDEGFVMLDVLSDADSPKTAFKNGWKLKFRELDANLAAPVDELRAVL